MTFQRQINRQRVQLRIEKYALRENTGGLGKYRGGCGIERRIKLLANEMKVSILAERHVLSPYGLKGGMEGTCGESYILRKGKKI